MTDGHQRDHHVDLNIWWTKQKAGNIHNVIHKQISQQKTAVKSFYYMMWIPIFQFKLALRCFSKFCFVWRNEGHIILPSGAGWTLTFIVFQGHVYTLVANFLPVELRDSEACLLLAGDLDHTDTGVVRLGLHMDIQHLNHTTSGTNIVTLAL